MSALFAFLHHLAAFALVAALAAEFLLLRGALNADTMRRVHWLDRAYGSCAAVLIVIGVARVLYFEKGATYYLHSAPFIAKMSLFLVIGLLSIYPTLQFVRWGRALRHAGAPVCDPQQLQRLRRVLQLELLLIVPLLLCAALMARGFGQIA